MATGSIDRKGAVGEMGIRELDGGALLFPSFTKEGVTYKVHVDSRYCSCPAATYRNVLCKHVITADAVEKSRNLPVGAKLAQARVLDMARRVFAKVCAGESCVASYDLFLEVAGSRVATNALAEAACKRHRRVLSLYEREAA